MVNKLCLINKPKLTVTYFNLIKGDQLDVSGPLVIIFGLIQHLLPYFACSYSEVSGKTAYDIGQDMNTF